MSNSLLLITLFLVKTVGFDKNRVSFIMIHCFRICMTFTVLAFECPLKYGLVNLRSAVFVDTLINVYSRCVTM